MDTDLELAMIRLESARVELIDSTDPESDPDTFDVACSHFWDARIDAERLGVR